MSHLIRFSSMRPAFIAAAVIVLLVAGAAGVSSAKEGESEEQVLRERATAYWKARVARDPKMLEFYPPVSLRAEGTVVAERGPIRFTSFEIEDVKIEGERALLQVAVQSHIDGRTPFPIPERVRNRTLSEAWVRLDGMWFKQTVTPALTAVGQELKTAFERRRKAREAAESDAENTGVVPEGDRGASEGSPEVGSHDPRSQ